MSPHDRHPPPAIVVTRPGNRRKFAHPFRERAKKDAGIANHSPGVRYVEYHVAKELVASACDEPTGFAGNFDDVRTENGKNHVHTRVDDGGTLLIASVCVVP